jgi:hypothetical protein
MERGGAAADLGPLEPEIAPHSRILRSPFLWIRKKTGKCRILAVFSAPFIAILGGSYYFYYMKKSI